MSDVLSFTETDDQSVELLPARTVLSLLHATDVGIIGTPGDSGTRGANGEGTLDSVWSGLIGTTDPATSLGSRGR